MDNKVLEAIADRRSCRSFAADKQISVQDMEIVVEAGAWAPSGMGRQSVTFVAVQDKATRDLLEQLNSEVLGKPDAKPFYGAPTVIVTLAKPVHTAVEDGALAMGHMMLAAQSLGLSSCWIHRAKEVFEGEEGQKLLAAWGLDSDYVGIGHLALGYREGEAPEPAPRNEGRFVEVL